MSFTTATLNEFRLQLTQLKTNSLPQIKRLTMLAAELKDVAHLVVDIVETHFNFCAPTHKLPVLYAVDSILKNVNGQSEYNALFSKRIIGMFEMVFAQADMKTRQSLYHLRTTWGSTGRFLHSKLYSLDMKINRIDDAWPIVTSRNCQTRPDATVSHETSTDNKENSKGLKRKASEPNTQANSPKIAKMWSNLTEISSILAKIPTQAPPVFKFEVKEEIKTDVFSLLKNLQKSGLLKPSSNENGACQFPEISLEALKSRKSSTVDSLLTKRSDLCKFCNLKLDDSKGKSQKYKDHMDFHVQQNLGNFSKSGAPHRQWYPTAMSWLTSKPVVTVVEVTQTVEISLGIESTGIKSKDCSVCNERFEEFYDDEEDTWRFKDTVKVKNMIVHNACASDAEKCAGNVNFLDDVKLKRCSGIDFGAF